MKKVISVLLVLVMATCLFSGCNTEKEPDPQNDPVIKNYGKIFYVAVDGNDANEGTKESPLATLGGAVAKVREYKAANGLPEGGIKVEFAAGTYKVTEQTDLTEEDSGEEGKEIVYAAADGAEVIFDGGIELKNSDFIHVTDEDVLAVLKNDEARANVLCLDLSKPEYAILFKADSNSFNQTLTSDGDIQTIARWPNGEFARAEIVDNSGALSLISADPKQIADWSSSPTFGWSGYGSVDWSDVWFFEGVTFDADRNAICVPNSKIVYPPVLSNMPYFVFNLLCELDEPGEYYRDDENKILYYWPSSDIAAARLTVSANSETAISLEDVKYITVKGIIFENYCKTAISGSADYFSLLDSTIRVCSDYAVRLKGKHDTLDGNTMYNLSMGGIDISGGDLFTPELCYNSLTNNHIYHYGLVRRTYKAALTLNGSGYYVAHNEIHDAPHNAISAGVSQSIIEYNEIYDVVKSSSDAGAIYYGRSWHFGYNAIRYNYFHDIIDELFHGTPYAVYLDDELALQHVYSNIIVNVGGVGVVGNGVRNCRIENNVVCNTGVKPFFNNDNGIGWFPQPSLYEEGSIWSYLKEPLKTKLWKYLYADLGTTIESNEYHIYYTDPIPDVAGFPGYNSWVNNVVYNYASDDEVIYKDRVEKIVLTKRPNEWIASTIGNNIEYFDSDLKDVFVDAANGNFFLKEDSKVYRDIIGFEKWDYSLIGRQK